MKEETELAWLIHFARRQGITNRHIADEFEVEDATVSRWARGYGSRRNDELVRILQEMIAEKLRDDVREWKEYVRGCKG